MRSPVPWLGVGMAAALLLSVAVARGQEENVPLDKVPRPVMEAVKARFANAQVTGASKETEKGKVTYEVTIKDRGQNTDVTVTPQGEILLIEKEIAARDLPRAAARAMEGKYPRATYKIVEEIVKVEKKQERLAYYEVLLVTAGKDTLEVLVTADGKIVKEEKKKPGEDD